MPMEKKLKNRGRSVSVPAVVYAGRRPSVRLVRLGRVADGPAGRGHGTSRYDLNGKHGVATDFHGYKADRSRDRYSVRLDSGETYKFRPTAVRAERVGAAGGVRPKAKGKGKKERG